MSKMLSDDEPAQMAPQTSWMDRWVDIEPAMPSLQARALEIAQGGSPSITQRKAEPVISLNLMLVAFITFAITTTLATIEFLFRRTV